MDIVLAKNVLVILVLVFTTAKQVCCLSFNYTSFPQNIRDNFIFEGQSNIVADVLQASLGLPGFQSNLSGRILYNKQLKLWRKRHGVASFNTSFVIVIKPQSDPPGEGLAFILTKDPGVPTNSYGQWLGITNAGTDGSPENNIIAVEFDTKKSFLEDFNDNHVGLDINSIKSINSTSLTRFGFNLSSDIVIATIDYDGNSRRMDIYVSKDKITESNSKIRIMSMPLDLSLYLPQDVYVGFSASTGSSIELNCVGEWYFSSSNIKEDDAYQLWIWISIPVTLGIVIGGLTCWLCKRTKQTSEIGQDEDATLDIETHCTKLGPKRYQFKKLKTATENFSTRNELGRGGFGTVYKGLLDGREVAVKRFMQTTKRGKQNLIAEVTTIGSIHHKNLVELIGWCYDSTELLLVYDFMPNNSLDKFISGNDSKQVCEEKSMILSWERRHNIICGVAHAIDYLHNECSRRVLHRDIKASNILLDTEFNARLGDFGLARTFKLGEKSHHTTKEIAGTLGYMAPEIFHTGRSTVETDVYAFGVLVLEVACGKKFIQKTEDDFRVGIIDWVWDSHKFGGLIKALDPKLKGEFNSTQAKALLTLGLACCHPNPNMRPSIRDSLKVLKEEGPPPEVPFEKPAFMWPASTQILINKQNHFSTGGILSSATEFSGR